MLLVEKGADIDGLPLQNAAENGHLEIVQYLITKGVNVEANDNKAIKLAHKNRRRDVVKLLALNGADMSGLGSITQCGLFD